LFSTAGGHKQGYVTLPMFNVMWKRYLILILIIVSIC